MQYLLLLLLIFLIFPRPSLCCGGTLSAASGDIQTPNYPGDYASNHYCQWYVTVAQGSRVEFKFLDWEVEVSYISFLKNQYFFFVFYPPIQGPVYLPV